MIGECVTIQRGQNLYFPRQTATGAKWTACTVRDINEHVKAAKVEYSWGKTTKTLWLPVSSLRFNNPQATT